MHKITHRDVLCNSEKERRKWQSIVVFIYSRNKCACKSKLISLSDDKESEIEKLGVLFSGYSFEAIQDRRMNLVHS